MLLGAGKQGELAEGEGKETRVRPVKTGKKQIDWNMSITTFTSQSSSQELRAAYTAHFSPVSHTTTL